MIRPIVQVPDPVLRATAGPVEAFDGGLRDLARDLLETMYEAPGRGLAAPQVGLPLRLFVMDVAWKEGDPDPRVFVNPEVLGSSEERVTREEGCLSIPGRLSRVSRPAEVALRWQDLDGVLCIDREEPAPEAEG